MSLVVWLPFVKDTQDQGIISLPSPSYNTLTQQTDGKLGKCYSGCAVYHLDNEILNNEWSLCTWVKSSSWSQANDIILCKNTSAADNCQFYFSIINGATFNIGINSGSSSASVSYTFATNTWYHVTATYDGSKYTLYINGEQKKTGTITNTLKTGMNNLGINCRSTNAAGTNQTGDGGKRLNDVRIYDHCLSAAEVKEIAQGLVLHYKLDDIINGIVQDSSGYGNNGEIIGTLTITDNSPRYTSATFFNSEPYIKKTDFNFTTNQWTISCWFKKTSSVTSSHETICGLTRNSGTDANKKFSLYIYNNKVAFVGEGSPHSNITTIDKSVWHHVCATNNQGTYKYYIDNVLKGTYTNSNNFTDCTDFVVGGRANVAGATSISTPWGGNISDIRVYATPLDEAAIKQLYEVSAKVDNKQNLHTYEFNENGSNKLTRTGILKDYTIEPYKTLSDGSYWKLMLFHYVDNGSNLFTSSNATYNNGFGLYSRLKDIANYTYDNKYEYYVIQDGKEFRWTQTSSPTAASITGLTTVSGYNNPVNGLAKPSSLTQTYIGYNSWWGACGCWTSYSTGGKTGIPGFGSHDGNGICTNYLALYTRIEKPKTEIANENIYAENLIEF